MKKAVFATIILLTVLLQMNIVFAARLGCSTELEGAYYNMTLGKPEGEVPRLVLNLSGQSTGLLAFHMVLDGAEWDVGKMASIDNDIQIIEASKNDIQVKFTREYFKDYSKDNKVEISLPLYTRNFSDGLIYLNIKDTPNYMEETSFIFASNQAGYFAIDYDENTPIYKSGISQLSDIVVRDKSSFALSPGKTEIKISITDNGFDFVGTPVVEGEGKYKGILTTEAVGNKSFVIHITEKTKAEAGSIKISGLKIIKNNNAKGAVPEFYVSAYGDAQYTSNEGVQQSRNYSERQYFEAGVASNEISSLTEANDDATVSSDENVLTFTVGGSSYTLNGETVRTEAPCIIINDRTLLPLRTLANAIGISDDDITYDSTTKTAVLKKGETETAIQQGSDTLIVNGMKIPVSAPADVYNSMMYIPVRDVCNAFGILPVNITYDGNSRMVRIIF